MNKYLVDLMKSCSLTDLEIKNYVEEVSENGFTIIEDVLPHGYHLKVKSCFRNLGVK